MTTLTIDGTPSAVVPAAPDPDMLQDGHDAAKAVRVGGVGGMTIDAQLRSQCAREAAAYHAMLAAADPSLLGAIVELRSALEAMRDHASKHATQWSDGGGSHHHPIWARVADVLARISVTETSDAG